MGNLENLDQIKQLADLLDRGIISSQEFNKKKTALLKDVGRSTLVPSRPRRIFAGLGAIMVVLVVASGLQHMMLSRSIALKVLPRSTSNVSWIKLSTVGVGEGSKPNYRGNDYPWPAFPIDDPANTYDPWGEQPRQCTSFVAWALYSRNGYSMPFYDNAKSWYNDALNRNIPTGTAPAVGAVAVDENGSYGHVAWVSALGDGTYTVEEYNRDGNGLYTSRSVLIGSPEFQHFIYFKNISTPSPATQAASNSVVTGAGVSQYAGDIVQWNGDTKNQKTSWFVTPDLKREWIPTIAIFNCLKAASTSGPIVLSTTTLDKLPDQIGTWVNCSSPALALDATLVPTTQPAPPPTTQPAPPPTTQPAPPPTTQPAPPPTTQPAPPPTTQPAPPPVYSETVGGIAHTHTNYIYAGDPEGPLIAAYQTVQISCRVTGFRVLDGDTWWYRIASSPWSNSFYVSADAFYNNGSTSGSLLGTPFYDPAVPLC